MRRKAEGRSSCRTAREWLSAYRDDEALYDPASRAHLEACEACASWSRTVDVVTRRLAVRSVGAPPVAAAAVAAFGQLQTRPLARQTRLARGLMAAAGVCAIVLAAIGMSQSLATMPSTEAHIGRELYAFEAALGLGFLLSAWRPRRYAAAMLPVTVAVMLMAVLPSAFELVGSTVDALTEASHLPVLVGLGALLLLFDASQQGRSRSGRTA